MTSISKLKNPYLFVTLLTCSIAFFSCSSIGRKPASSLPPDFQDGMVPGAQKILSHVTDPTFNSAECVTYLKELQTEIPLIQPSDAGDDLTSHSQELVGLLWKIRLSLHQRLPEFSADCVTEVRNTARLFRFIEDFLAEKDAHPESLDPDQYDFTKEKTPVVTQAPEYLTLTNPDFSNFEFKNGDLMLARGPSFLSAIISRIGDVSSQFSHVIMVHVDKDTKKVETIEAYVGPGTGVYDIDYALKNENVRLLLLRSKDQDLASRAADFMYAKAKAAIASGHPIPYDYKFNFVDHSALSCAEASLWGYQAASDGKVMLPYYPSNISANKDFLKRIGMSQGKTFTPGDLEVDPRFDMVMEWRDLRFTRDSRVKDSIMTSMLNWIDNDQYKLHDTLTSDAAGYIVWPARRTFIWPLVQKVLKVQDFSKDIPQGLFQTVALLNQIGEVFLGEMKAEDAAFEKKTGWPMTYQDLYAGLEEFRAKDLAVYRDSDTRGDSKFHFAFRPPKSWRPVAPVPVDADTSGSGN
jgi:hypothetical protein